MDQSWSEFVGTREWRRDAEEWIDNVLAQRGINVTGPIEQPRIRPWSTQLIIPTDLGTVWFKANCPGYAFEPGLQRTLARLLPDEVDAPLGADTSRGWMLTSDHGPSLGEIDEPTLAQWKDVVSKVAQMQRALVDHRDELLATDLPNHSPLTVPDRLDRLIERMTRLPADHPTHLEPELARRLEAARPAVVEATSLLDTSPIPSTFQHGDVHPRNVFVADGRMRVFDFGDSMWSFALEAMSVPFGMIAASNSIEWAPVHDAYREHWTDLVTPRDYDALWHACGVTHAVNRTMTWWRALQGASPEEWAGPWGEAPRRALSNVLDAPYLGGGR